MASGIYKITNIVNQKMYVGSAVNLNNRFAGHLCKLRKDKHANSHLQAALLREAKKREGAPTYVKPEWMSGWENSK